MVQFVLCFLIEHQISNMHAINSIKLMDIIFMLVSAAVAAVTAAHPVQTVKAHRARHPIHPTPTAIRHLPAPVLLRPAIRINLCTPFSSFLHLYILFAVYGSTNNNTSEFWRKLTKRKGKNLFCTFVFFLFSIKHSKSKTIIIGVWIQTNSEEWAGSENAIILQIPTNLIVSREIKKKFNSFLRKTNDR